MIKWIEKRQKISTARKEIRAAVIGIQKRKRCGGSMAEIYLQNTFDSIISCSVGKEHKKESIAQQKKALREMIRRIDVCLAAKIIPAESRLASYNSYIVELYQTMRSLEREDYYWACWYAGDVIHDNCSIPAMTVLGDLTKKYLDNRV